jgi:hypothetical protein
LYLFFIPQEADEKLKLLDLAQTEKKSVKVNDPFLRYLPSYAGDFNFLMQCILQGLELFLESANEVKSIDSKPNTIAQNDAKKPTKTFDVPLKSAAVHRSNRVLFREEGIAL